VDASWKVSGENDHALGSLLGRLSRTVSCSAKVLPRRKMLLYDFIRVKVAVAKDDNSLIDGGHAQCLPSLSDEAALQEAEAGQNIDGNILSRVTGDETCTQLSV